MPRYFLEVSYKGANYAGFQIQQNANSIQAEVEKALGIFFKAAFSLTGSSRTDAGVHALSNYFHFDSESLSCYTLEQLNKAVYNLNAILPDDIVVSSIRNVADLAHCRFDAHSREYKYHIYQSKDPFLSDRAYYYPYTLDVDVLQKVATLIQSHNDFTSFSKRNTQVTSFNCTILKSEWLLEQNVLVYNIQANRFLRGMVRGLVGTMLKAGRGKISVDEFQSILLSRDCTQADFSVPAHGLFLVKVEY
jgi:tRNA pseudouridine38-40 synthase